MYEYMFLTFYYHPVYETPNKFAVTCMKKGATDRQMAGEQGLLVIIKVGGILHKIKVLTYDSDTIFTK